MNSKATLTIAAVLLIAASFYGGMKYDQTTNMASVMNAARGGRGGFNRGGMNGGFVNGQVLSIDDKSITVSMKSGGSKLVLISGSTSVMKSDNGSLSDVTVGKQISVMGSANSDGSITAESIQIRPDLPVANNQN